MKQLIPFVSAIVILMGCGGGGGGSAPAPAPTPHVPSISNLTYTTPMTFPQGSGGGAETVGWTFDFIDAGKDLTTLVFEGIDDTSGAVIRTYSVTLSGTAGMLQGTVGTTGIFPTSTSGHHVFRIHALDSVGNASNKLAGAYDVTAFSIQLNGSPSSKMENTEPFDFNVKDVQATLH